MDRLQKIERELKIYRVLVICLVAFAIIGAGKTTTVEANRFVLRDSTGKVRGYLGVDEGRQGATNTTALVFYDQHGNCRTQLYARDDVTALHMIPGESNHSPAEITIQSGRRGGSWIEIINQYRQILFKVENQGASTEIKSRRSESTIGSKIEMIDHPRSVFIDR